jgi:hypothetical protein
MKISDLINAPVPQLANLDRRLQRATAGIVSLSNEAVVR